MSRRDDILEIASKTFREYGYQKANLSYIAGLCGMNKAGLYYYFDNKEELFMSMLEKDIGIVQEKLTSILDGSNSFYQRLRQFMIYRTSSFGLMKKYLDMFSQGVAPPKLRELAFNVKNRYNSYEIDLLSNFLERYLNSQGPEGIKPYYLALTLLGVSEKIGLLSFHANFKIDIEETIEEVLKLFHLNRLRKRNVRAPCSSTGAGFVVQKRERPSPLLKHRGRLSTGAGFVVQKKENIL